MRCLSSALLALSFAAGALAADEKKDQSKPEKPAITIELIANKKTYPLDRGGKTAEQLRADLKNAEKAGKRLQAPEVDLTLELTNISDKEVRIWKNGDPVVLHLELKGKGAVNLKPRLAMTREFRIPQAVSIGPGKKYTLAIKHLQGGMRGVSEAAFWTEPGEYTLIARFQTAIAPPPANAKNVRDGFGRVTLTSKPVKLQVEEKK